MILSKLDYLPCGNKVFQIDGDKIDTVLEGGEVELVSRSFYLSVVY